MCAIAAGASSRAVEEWLVTDQRGAFAMGTAAGVRTRKYHAFYAGIAGRAETAYLSDFELMLNGKALWPHRYASGGEPVVFPDPLSAATAFAYAPFKGFPCWRWELPAGKLAFWIEPGAQGGIQLNWKWRPESRGSATLALLEVRPFFAMRTLHGIGGQEWTIGLESKGRVARIEAAAKEVFVRLNGAWSWRPEPLWYERFLYSEELARGYSSQERLYSAGTFGADLNRAKGGAVSWLVGQSRETAIAWPASAKNPRTKARPAALDFVLREPAGICAGFPWFGEWGRDTFIALPGIVAAWSRAGGDPEEIRSWAREVLLRWGDWIRTSGMIPNLIGKDGVPQWESADGTLWWCHSLAALWAFGLGVEDLDDLLSMAVTAIEAGRHRYLKVAEDGMLEVTEPHSTWMDARVDGKAVTPRLGKLPEINALWFQARCLRGIWSNQRLNGSSEEIERLGRLALEKCREPERPNEVFLHSLPLAPSFVLRETRALSDQLSPLASQLWTPVGLRTLSPRNPAYRATCAGDQRTRDLAYHQGPPWAWLAGHYQMARARMVRSAGVPDIRFVPEAAEWGPIKTHVAELFDAEPPFAPRGTPAQAWSIACFEEAAARRRLRIDARITGVLAQRWLAQLGRNT